MSNETTTTSPLGAPAIPDFPQITTAQIEAAILAFGMEPSEFAGYEGWDFESRVLDVGSALRDAEVFGPFRAYPVFEWAEDGTSGGCVSVTIPDGPTVCGPGRDIKHMTDDREATGMAGLVAIAESIIGDAAYAVSSLRRWVTGPGA